MMSNWPKTAGCIAFVSILSLFVLLEYRATSAAVESRREAFQNHVTEAAGIVEERVNLVLSELRAVSAMAETSLSRDSLHLSRDFHSYLGVAGVHERHPELLAIGVATKVASTEFQEWARAVDADPFRRAFGYPELRLRSAPGVSDHMVITAAIPQRSWRNLVGFDLYSEQIRAETGLRAEVTGEGQITSRIDLISKKPGVVLMQPIFSGDEAERTVRGLVVSAYATASLVQKLGVHLQHLGLVLEIHDIGGDASRRVEDLDLSSLLSADYTASLPREDWAGRLISESPDSWVSYADIAIGGRIWRVVGAPAPGSVFANPHGSSRLAIIALGLLIAALFGFLTYSQLAKSRELARRVEEKVRDIEASRKELEIARSHEHELAEVVRMANDAVVTTDLEGLVVWCNPAFESISGYASDEIIGRKPGDVLQGPGTDKAIVVQLRTAIEKLEPIDVEILNYSRHGVPYWIELSVSLVFDSTGQAQRIMAVSRDITEKRQRRQDLEAALSHIDYAVCFMDENLRIDLINDRFAEIFDLPRDFLLQRPDARQVITHPLAELFQAVMVR